MRRAARREPPARFTEATLLSAMEGAGKLIEDDELREAMREKGLGTPATRAQIIEGLISEKYVHREGRELHADRKGVFADDAAARPGRAGAVSRRSSPPNGSSSSRRWSTASSSAKQFMREIVEMTQHIVGAGEELRERHDPRRLRDAHRRRCPKCGGEVHENYKKFQCQSLRLRHVEDHRRPPARARRSRDAAERSRSRAARRLSQQARAGRSRPS